MFVLLPFGSVCYTGKATRLSGRFIPNGDFKSTKKVTWLAKVRDTDKKKPHYICIMFFFFEVVTWWK